MRRVRPISKGGGCPSSRIGWRSWWGGTGRRGCHQGAWTSCTPRRPGRSGRRVGRARWRDGGADLNLLGCYHVSQQNTFTGTLTPEMLRDVLRRARELAGI
ncbi:hypothetical protein GCM10020366_66570 [Saccharopolyspora gregorii]|uniref:Uracil-DNA glycosylase-like domain-containing protein n=1 Tax=Saccharopolyspora gregorii TaxID=33914 RepID=A0ABP6S1K8_9PSEU